MNEKFQILMVSSERSNSDLSESTLFQFKIKKFTYKNPFLGDFIAVFQITSKVQRFYKL